MKIQVSNTDESSDGSQSVSDDALKLIHTSYLESAQFFIKAILDEVVSK